MKLTRIEKNKIYGAIAAGVLDPAECSLNQYDDQVEIRHKNSGSTFKFGPPIETFFGLRQSVTYDVVDGHNNTAYAQPGIDNLTPIIRNWASEVKQIFEAPDLWAEMQRSRELITDIQRTGSGNTPFTQDEQRQIGAQLEAIKKELAGKFELTSEHSTFAVFGAGRLGSAEDVAWPLLVVSDVVCALSSAARCCRV